MGLIGQCHTSLCSFARALTILHINNDTYAHIITILDLAAMGSGER